MEKRIIRGTAGHIDHGKTALVRAMTGVDTDRLQEEKRRGITIELGFTSLELPSGPKVGIVDMPGHEKFIDHMVAGASGIDLVLLVVAADEGVMPQTVEHLEICRQLGIRTGLVALTKVDLVDEEMRSLAEEDVRDLTRGTFLQDQPVVPFSTVTGEGSQELLQELDRIAETYTERRSDGVPRMPIDRVFTMKGFGTVVTGTLLAGKLKVGEPVDILPSGHRAKIRGIQVHNQAVQEAQAGSRTAVNLQGIEKSVVQRGEVLVAPGRFQPSYRIYLQFQYQPQHPRPLPDRFRVMLHWGTARVFGRIRFLSGPEPMEPGTTGLAQIHMERPIFPVFGDRLIVRDFSTNQTLGGGIILDPHAVKYKIKQKETTLPWLARLQNEDPRDRILYALWKGKCQGTSLKELALWTQLSEAETAGICGELTETGDLVEADPDAKVYLPREALESLQASVLEQIRLFHEKNPYQSGMPKEAAAGGLREPVPDRFVGFAVTQLAEKGDVILEKDRVRLAAHRIRLSEKDEKLCGKVQAALLEKGVMPPTVKELAEETGSTEQALRPLLDYLTNAKEIVKLNESLYFASEVLEDLKTRLVDYLHENTEIQAGDFKTFSQTTRKYTIPLMEYFDRTRLTLRLGDRRVLREKKS
jgi:selenocysteine-specific elongation factor